MFSKRKKLEANLRDAAKRLDEVANYKVELIRGKFDSDTQTISVQDVVSRLHEILYY